MSIKIISRKKYTLQWLQTLRIALILAIEIRAEMGFLKTTNSFEKKDYNWGLNGGELEIN
jgi:hypothetical protein